MRRKIVIIVLFLFIFSIVACGSSDKEINVGSFEIDKATEAGKEYLKELSLDKANNIKSYSLNKVSESSNYIVLNYSVVRKKDNDINVDLDQFDVKVYKSEDKYNVEQLKATNVMQVYVDGVNLRIRDRDTGMSDLLLRKKDLPVEVYPKNQDIMINKVDVKNGDYYLLAIDFKGKNVGVITKNNDKYFIVLAQVENSTETVGEAPQGSENNGGTTDINQLEEIMEKPVASKVVPYDLITAQEITNMIFTADAGFLLIQQENNGVGTINIYKNPIGQLVDMNLGEIFPSDKYSLSIHNISEEGTFINVKAIGSDKTEEGIYKLDLKSKKILKKE